MRDLLLTGLDYDLWANHTWLSMLQKIPDAGPLVEIFHHIVFAQRIWGTRCGLEAMSQQSESIEHLLRTYHAAWKGLATDRDLDEVIAYRNLKGEENARPLGEIMWHLMNHGTYHRGQMRAVAEAQGLTQWPDTDLIYFFDEMRGNRK